jgi:deoxyribodipyrimidine photolyase-related protein
MRGVYVTRGRQQRTSNYFQHRRSLPQSFYNGTTGIAPVDHVIKQVQATAYCHHIERLMVLGNIMLLCEFHPTQVYRWFMELFIDAYDWVMVPNVYAMSQYADGGGMTTKPYISSSNYILKMSNHERGSWCDIWDGLYWRFIEKHRDSFAKNHRMSMMVHQLEKLDGAKQKRLFKAADVFLDG